MSVIKNFLLVFDHEQGKLVEEREFGTDVESAMRAYADTERAYRNNNRVEVVLIGSDSLDTVKITHANYFDGTVAVSRFLAGI